MKNLKKVFVTSLVSLFMVFGVASIASAATYADGTYLSETAGGAMTKKLNVTVEGGKITKANVQLFYGETEFTEELAASNEQVKGIVDNQKAMCEELISANDGSALTTADDEFKALVADFESQAKVEEAAAEETSTDSAATTTSVPKTGVVGLGLVYGLGALATGAYALKRNK